MTSDQVVAILRHYNAWRRDDEAVKMPEPRVVGEAIDAAIHLLSARKSAKIGEALNVKCKQEESDETV